MLKVILIILNILLFLIGLALVVLCAFAIILKHEYTALFGLALGIYFILDSLKNFQYA